MFPELLPPEELLPEGVFPLLSAPADEELPLLAELLLPLLLPEVLDAFPPADEELPLLEPEVLVLFALALLVPVAAPLAVPAGVVAGVVVDFKVGVVVFGLASLSEAGVALLLAVEDAFWLSIFSRRRSLASSQSTNCCRSSFTEL